MLVGFEQAQRPGHRRTRGLSRLRRQVSFMQLFGLRAAIAIVVDAILIHAVLVPPFIKSPGGQLVGAGTAASAGPPHRAW
jgi:hypothetical protein